MATTVSGRDPASGPLVPSSSLTWLSNPTQTSITSASRAMSAAESAHLAPFSSAVARRAGALSELARRLPGEPALYRADVADAGAMQQSARDFMGCGSSGR